MTLLLSAGGGPGNLAQWVWPVAAERLPGLLARVVGLRTRKRIAGPGAQTERRGVTVSGEGFCLQAEPHRPYPTNLLSVCRAADWRVSRHVRLSVGA